VFTGKIKLSDFPLPAVLVTRNLGPFSVVFC